MLKHVLETHFAQGASLAKNRLGIGQRMPPGYALMENRDGLLYWVNEHNEMCSPIKTNDARVIRHSANVHKLKATKDGMERVQR